MNKKLMSFMLIVSLLILPSSRAYAWSWDYWQGLVQSPVNFISQSIDKDVAKKLFPIVILATLAAIYLFMGKKSSESIDDKKSDEESEEMSSSVAFDEESSQEENIRPHA